MTHILLVTDVAAADAAIAAGLLDADRESDALKGADERILGSAADCPLVSALADGVSVAVALGNSGDGDSQGEDGDEELHVEVVVGIERTIGSCKSEWCCGSEDACCSDCCDELMIKLGVEDVRSYIHILRVLNIVSLLL